MAGRGSPPLRLRRQLRVSIAKRARSLREPHRVVMRARIIILAVEGVPNAEIGRRLQLSESCVRKWRRRIEARPQVTTLRDAPRSGRPPEIPVTVRWELVKLACQRPADCPRRRSGGVDTPYAPASVVAGHRGLAEPERDHADASMRRFATTSGSQRTLGTLGLPGVCSDRPFMHRHSRNNCTSC